MNSPVSGFRPARHSSHSPFATKYYPVPGEGPMPARIMLIGERPGENEARRRRPFVGRAGEILNTCLTAADLKRSDIYVTNLVKTYSDYSKPTVEEIERDWPELCDEITAVNPEIVGLLGTFAVEKLLGVDRAELERTHGVPVQPVHLRDLLAGRVVLPMYHPASAFYSPEALALVLDDFLRLAQLNAGEITVRKDSYAGSERYERWDGEFYTRTATAIDTEGSRHRPWCLTFSTRPGTAYLVKPGQRGTFGGRIYLHNSLHDLGVLRQMGFEVRDDQFTDTMVLAYHLCVEPQGLKDLAYRYAAMDMESYQDIIREPGRRKAVEYLQRVASMDWPTPPPYLVMEKGVYREKKPWNISKYAKRALSDLESGKVDKDGNPPDLRERWHKWDETVKGPVVEVLGDMPEATLDDVDPAVAERYACRDADATLRIAPILEQKVRDMGLEEAVRVDHAVLPMIDRMQEVGIKLAPTPFWDEIERACHLQMGRAKYQIFKMTGADINPASGDQVASLLYDQLGLTPPKMTESGSRGSTNDKCLEALLGRAPVVEHVMDYREADKVRGTFVLPLRSCAEQGDGRVRANFRVTRVSSGRLATADPNLLAIPIRSDLGRTVRGGFIAAEGHCIGDWDLSQIEMRLMAHESRDKELMRVFETDQDMHINTASKIFSVSANNIDKKDPRRQAGKIAGFAIINGITAPGLVDQMILYRCSRPDGERWTVDDCEWLLKEWFGVYPGVRRFQNETVAEAQRTGLARESISGRIRWLPAVWSTDNRIRAEAERQSYSHKIQSGAQALLKRAMAVIWGYMKQVKSDYPHWFLEPLLQVHDELLFEMTDDPLLKNLFGGLVIDAMRNTTTLRIPVDADGGFGYSWLEAH